MSPTDFEWLIKLIGPKIKRNDTHWRKAISVQERLAVTIRFLETGDSFTSLQYLSKISKQLISTIVPEVCEALIEGIKENIQIPNTSEAWLEVAKVYNNRWNFPHCLGALDVDADYNFLYVDAGGQGRISDGGIFKNCSLYKKLQNNELNLLQAEPLDGRHREVPYFFIGDEAFSLTSTLMKPFSGIHRKGSFQRIFNYRLSCARRVVENVFGIASAIFQILRKPLLLEPEKATLIVLTVAHLHNFLRKSSTSCRLYTPHEIFDTEREGQFVPGTYRSIASEPMYSLLSLNRIPRRPSTDATQIREELADFFLNEGSILWQDNYS
ncbi:uncharacterized protein LOC143305535 [Osmia lignaria lignaria]|uniref:uncharacterized protein LOC143305535 n=1 Tax=Osmia lignaria lignaria TaxID=1437193 RepID=UPI00402B3D1B